MTAQDWQAARKLVRQATHVAVATCGPDGQPHVTPIGSLSLHPHEPRGYGLEKVTAEMPRNLASDDRVQILAVRRSLWFWVKSLWRGKFAEPPSVRLTGTAGPRRPLTAEELQRFRKRVRFLKPLKGHDLLWAQMGTARDITIDEITAVRLGRMWPPAKGTIPVTTGSAPGASPR